MQSRAHTFRCFRFFLYTQIKGKKKKKNFIWFFAQRGLSKTGGKNRKAYASFSPFCNVALEFKSSSKEILAVSTPPASHSSKTTCLKCSRLTSWRRAVANALKIKKKVPRHAISACAAEAAANHEWYLLCGVPVCLCVLISAPLPSYSNLGGSALPYLARVHIPAEKQPV